MKKTSYILALLAAASALLISSCAKETGNGFDAVLSFSTDTPELVEVKAAAATNVTDFFTIGYGSSQWFPNSGGPQRVQISGGSATFDTYKWKMGDTKTFFAYSNNLPASGATAAITNSGVTLTYTAIPTEASAQTDVTLGRYSGNGDNKGTAAMTFYHPLAQVVFKMGDMVGVSKIDKIEIKGVYNAGTTTLTTSTTTSGTPAVANFSWTGISGSATVSQTVNSLPSKGSEFGTPLMLIPQNLATQNVTVSVTVTSTYSSSPVTLTKKLTSGSFATGKKTVCTLTVNPTRELGCTLAAYTADNDDDIFKTEQLKDEIWYTTSDGQPITIYTAKGKQAIDYFGVNLLSNTYAGGKGILKFDGDIQKIAGFNDYSPFFDNANLTSISLPPSSIPLESECFAMNYGCTIYFPDTYTSKNVSGYIFWYAAYYGTHTFNLVTSKGTTEYISDNHFSTMVEFADGSKVYLYNGYCFAKGTLITLADGSRKPVEELEFSDKIRVWNFDEGHEDIAGILWMMRGESKFGYYYRCTFSDGTTLDVVGEDGGSCHRIFDRTKGSFTRGHSIDIGDEVYTENGFVTLVSCEKIDEEVELYNVVTERHINCFTNGVLTSARYNNRYPIDQDMKFVKDGRKIRPYREFKKVGISRQWYDGMRLGEVQDSVDVVRKYINRSESLGNLNPDWKEPGFFARIWNWIKALFSK